MAAGHQLILSMLQIYNETTRSMRSVQMFYIICFAILLLVNGYAISMGASLSFMLVVILKEAI